MIQSNVTTEHKPVTAPSDAWQQGFFLPKCWKLRVSWLSLICQILCTSVWGPWWPSRPAMNSGTARLNQCFDCPWVWLWTSWVHFVLLLTSSTTQRSWQTSVPTLAQVTMVTLWTDTRQFLTEMLDHLARLVNRQLSCLFGPYHPSQPGRQISKLKNLIVNGLNGFRL